MSGSLSHIEPARCPCCGIRLEWVDVPQRDANTGKRTVGRQARDLTSGGIHAMTCTESPFAQPTRARALEQAHLVQSDLEGAG